MKIHLFLFFSFLSLSQVAYAAGDSGNPILDFAYKVVNFSALVGIIFFFAKKPVSAMMNQKAVTEKQEASQLEEQLLGLEKEIQSKKQELTEYKSKSKFILEEASQSAASEERSLIAQAQLASERMKEQTTQSIQHGYAKAKTDLLEWATSHLVSDVQDKLRKSPQTGDVLTQYEKF